MSDRPDVERTDLGELDATPHATVFEHDSPRVVRLGLAAGESVPAHEHPESNVVIHVIEGRLEITLDDETDELEPGDVLRFDGDRTVRPEAREDSVAVVILAAKS